MPSRSPDSRATNHHRISRPKKNPPRARPFFIASLRGSSCASWLRVYSTAAFPFPSQRPISALPSLVAIPYRPHHLPHKHSNRRNSPRNFPAISPVHRASNATATPIAFLLVKEYAMPIDAVNSAMTPAAIRPPPRSANRTVETKRRPHLPRRQRPFLRPNRRNRPPLPSPPHSRTGSLPPTTFHWSYRLSRVNGKPVAKRTPQFADTNFWSIAINRLG